MIYTKKKNTGSVMIFTTLFFISISMILLSGLSYVSVKSIKNIRNTIIGKTNYYVAEAGMEDALYRLKNSFLIYPNTTLTIDANSASVNFIDTYDGYTTLSSVASTGGYYKSLQAKLTLSTNVSFKYGIEAGSGGITLSNSSYVTGTVHSNGTIKSLSSSGSNVYGDIIGVGPNGNTFGIHATGSVWAHTIGSSTNYATQIDKNAYYQTIANNVTVTGTSYPGTADISTTSTPIPDALITKWEADATAGTTLTSSWCDTYSNGVCTIKDPKTIGASVIPFDLVIKSTGNTATILTVSGPVWIKGNLTVQTSGGIKIASSLGDSNVPIIVDKTTDRLNSSTVTVQQGASFTGSGSVNSWVFIISQNNSAENGGSIVAFSMQQGSSALVVYAAHGLLSLSQSAQVVSASAYQVALEQTSNVIFDKNLANVLFSTGSNSAFSIVNWQQI